MNKRLFLYAAIALGSVGCENFLEEEPQDSLTTTSFYTTAQDAISAINAAYDGFQHLDYYGFNYPMILNISGADAIKGGFGAGRPTGLPGIRKLQRHQRKRTEPGVLPVGLGRSEPGQRGCWKTCRRWK